jgi:carbon monoxide dehydrogenase subunit G
MNLQWKGSEHIAADEAATWAFINDPAQIAQCLPDLLEAKIHDAHAFDAIVGVALGPVRGKFKFKIVLDPQPDGSQMKMKISGGGLGSVVDLLAGAQLRGNADGTTTLDWEGTASMRGPVATVGGRVIDVQAERVISTTFANVKTRLAAAATNTVTPASTGTPA